MFEGKAFCFGDEEVGEDNAGETCGSPGINKNEINLFKPTCMCMSGTHQIKNTLTAKWAVLTPAGPVVEGSTRYGVAYPIAKFHNQFEAVDNDMPLARMERGKISPVTTQATGPQEIAKNAM